MAKQQVVTLLTDFGEQDGYVASMKGVLLSLLPGVTIVDISHQIEPGNVTAGAYVLNQAFGYFPAGTVHVAVVDPGVGTDRRILAARYASQAIVCPDNGLLTLLDRMHALEEIASVRNEDLFLQDRVGRTFDGRDVMAPVAAAIAGGTRLRQLGPQPETYALLELPEPAFDGEQLAGQVIHIDRFGNCATNLSRQMIEDSFPQATQRVVWAGERPIGPLHGAFGHVEPGQPVALTNSMDLLELAVNGGRACDELKLYVGSQVSVRHSHAMPSAEGVR